MPRDSSGDYTRAGAGSGVPYTSGEVASSTLINGEFDDLGAEIAASLEASGKKTWTDNQNANGYGVKTLANTKVHTTAGGTTAYTVTTGAAFMSYAQLPIVFVKANATNTDSMTVNVDAIGALTVKKGGSNLAAGDFVQDRIYALAYDGTNLQLIGGDLSPLYETKDADLTAIAALGYVSGAYLIKKTAAATYSIIPVSSFAETLLDDADASTARGTLGVGDGSFTNRDTDRTATSGDRDFWVLTANRTLTLPSSPSTGAWYEFAIVPGGYVLTIARNGSTIEGQSDNMTVGLRWRGVLHYDGSTWRVG